MLSSPGLRRRRLGVELCRAPDRRVDRRQHTQTEGARNLAHLRADFPAPITSSVAPTRSRQR